MELSWWQDNAWWQPNALRLFAAGAIVANVMVLYALIRRLVVKLRGRYQRPALLERWALPIAALAATAAALGSLSLSEIGPYEPCRWCWYQRVAMYPIALVLMIGWATRDRNARRYAVPLSLMGLVISIWHYLIQRFPDLAAEGACDAMNPCTLTLTWQFRFVSIPYMAGSVFALVATLLILNWANERN